MSTRKERIAQNKKTMGKQYGATIKIGAKGKNYNRYDPKTGKWVKVSSASGAKPKMSPTRTSRNTASGTVTSARAQGAAGGKGSGNGTKPGTKAAMAGYVRGGGVNRNPRGVPGASIAMRKNRRNEDTRNQGRNAAAIAGLTIGPIVEGGLAAGGTAAAAGRAAIGAAGRRALPAGRKAIGSGGRVVKSTKKPTSPKPAPARTTVTDMRNGNTATARGVQSGQVPKAALTRGTPAQRGAATRAKNRRAKKK